MKPSTITRSIPLNSHLILRLGYNDYVLPIEFMPTVMDMMQYMERVDNEVIKTVGDNGIKYLAERDYMVYKANALLTD